MKERGMMKWISYKSLNEQEKYLAKMLEKKSYLEKPSISSDKAEEINNLLCEYSGEDVCLTFYSLGKIKESRGQIKNIDGIFKIIEINEMKISFSSIVNLELI